MAAEVEQPLTLSLQSCRWYAGHGGHEQADSKIRVMGTCSR
jgi:hypothetical protein